MEKKRDKKGRILRNGERQRSDGRYEFRYLNRDGEQCSLYSWRLVETDPTPQGKRHCEPLRSLEDKLAEQKIFQLDIKKANSMTVDNAYDIYMSLHPKWKPSTRHNKRQLYKNHIKEKFGNRKLADLRNSEIKAYYIYMQEKENLNFGTVRQIHALLYSILECAVDDDILKRNPAKNATKDIVINEPIKHHPLTQDQQNRLIRFMKTSKRFEHWMPYLVFLLGTGVRNGEASALVWENVDFDANVITINGNMIDYKDDNDIRIRERSTPKTESGKREIPMLDDVKELLRNEYSKAQFELKKTNIGKERVFKTSKGTEVRQNHADRVMSQIRNEFNEFDERIAVMEGRKPDPLPPFTPHTFRRTFCTRLCERNENIKVIQRVMGHKDIQTTLDIYAEATRDFVKEEFENLQMKIV